MRGAIYRFECEDGCGALTVERFCWDDDLGTQTCTCGGKLRRIIERKSTGLDYDVPVLSDAMGVSPDQVEEHRRLHPSIPMTDDGRVIVRNHSEGKRIRRELGFYDKDGYTR